MRFVQSLGMQCSAFVRIALVTASVCGMAACESTEPHYTQPSRVPTVGSGLVQYTAYEGSDRDFHYFASRYGLKRRVYKVPRDAMPYWKTPIAPHGKIHDVYVERNREGELIPIKRKK